MESEGRKDNWEMINDNFYPNPIDPTSFRIPTETENAISETLKLCGISGEDASRMFIEVMKKIGKYDNISECCRSEEKIPSVQPEQKIMKWIDNTAGQRWRE